MTFIFTYVNIYNAAIKYAAYRILYNDYDYISPTCTGCGAAAELKNKKIVWASKYAYIYPERF